LTISQREIMSKILNSEENRKRYFSALEKASVKIENSEIKAYHDICQKEYGNIRFTGIAGAENKKAQDINDFYVENTFSYYVTKEYRDIYREGIEQIEPIKLNDFFNIGNKIVLIGAAGLGKTTTLNYLFCNYEEMYHSYSLKVKIDLKEYAKEIGENKKDLLWCIATEFSKKIKRTRMSFEEREKVLGELLENGKCLIILDALDEIPTQPVRDKVRDVIGYFCEIYYLNRYIISTREAGYLRNRFDDSFLHIKINDFGERQIKKYSENWFGCYYEQKDFGDFWDKFFAEVKRARCKNLIGNPIVLILALVIFDIEKNLPNRRVEFYKKCIETFLTVREDRKGAFILSEKAKNILIMDSVVPKIAHYKYSHIKENIGYRFSHGELRRAVLDAIEVEDEVNWSEAIKQYAEYLVERTELIREIDEDILDFAHKTFYEYFLAVYFAKEYDNEKLIGQLQEWIGDPNNDELARLIIEVIIQNDDPRQHKAIINYMFDRLRSDNKDARWDNRDDIFMIVADLYSHNMLLPKFHSQYNKTILYYPRYVDNANRLLERNYKYKGNAGSEVKYDSKILADMFCDAVRTNKEFNLVLDSLYYLDRDFRNYVKSQLEEDSITHILELFSAIRSVDFREKEKNVKKYEGALEYFLNDGFDMVLKYSQMYVSVIVLSILGKVKIDICRFFEFKFNENQSFYYYSVSEALLYLIDLASGNKDAFLLLLILIIKCGKSRTNVFIGYLLDIDSKKERSKAYLKEGVADFTFWLWNALNFGEGYKKFKEELSGRDLIIMEYEDIYEDLYSSYIENGKGVRDRRIKKYIEEISK